MTIRNHVERASSQDTPITGTTYIYISSSRRAVIQRVNSVWQFSAVKDGGAGEPLFALEVAVFPTLTLRQAEHLYTMVYLEGESSGQIIGQRSTRQAVRNALGM